MVDLNPTYLMLNLNEKTDPSYKMDTYQDTAWFQSEPNLFISQLVSLSFSNYFLQGSTLIAINLQELALVWPIFLFTMIDLLYPTKFMNRINQFLYSDINHSQSKSFVFFIQEMALADSNSFLLRIGMPNSSFFLKWFSQTNRSEFAYVRVILRLPISSWHRVWMVGPNWIYIWNPRRILRKCILHT